jgi:hypothetical protein
MAKTGNRNTCAPAAIISARAPRRRLVNAKPSGSTPDQYLRPEERTDEHGSAPGDFRHVLLDDPLALIVKGARYFVEDQDAGIHHEGTCNGDALAQPSSSIP